MDFEVLGELTKVETIATGSGFCGGAPEQRRNRLGRDTLV
jgi:hypothetical protein